MKKILNFLRILFFMSLSLLVIFMLKEYVTLLNNDITRAVLYSHVLGIKIENYKIIFIVFIMHILIILIFIFLTLVFKNRLNSKNNIGVIAMIKFSLWGGIFYSIFALTIGAFIAGNTVSLVGFLLNQLIAMVFYPAIPTFILFFGFIHEFISYEEESKKAPI